MLSHGSASAASPSARARVVLLASIAALVVTTFDAHAAPVARASAATGVEQASADGTDFSARRRWRRGGNAAGLAMMGMMVGVIGGAIAAQHRRDSYERAYATPYYGGYSQHYGGYPQGQSYGNYQPRGYYQPQPQYRGARDVNGYTAQDHLLNQQSGAINYGPPRIGW